MRLNLFGAFLIEASLALIFATGQLFAASIEPPNQFDGGETHGWTAGVSSAFPKHQPDGGPTGDGDGFLRIDAQGGNGPASIVATFNDDPAWTGDYATPGITGLSIDMMNPLSTPLSMRLLLFGPDTTNNRWTSIEANIVPGDGEWRNYVFPIGEADLTSVGGTATYDEMFNNVVRLLLRHDAGTPSRGGTAGVGTLGIDNIAFVAGLPFDCNADGVVDASDLACANSAGITSALLEDLNLLAGDFDGLNGVGFSDFLVLSSNFGSTTDNYLEGDIDGDGTVAFADFLLLSQNFGKASAGLAVVPEPSGSVMFCLGLLSLIQFSWRTSKRSVAAAKNSTNL